MRDPRVDASQTPAAPRQWEQIALQLESPGSTSDIAAPPADNPARAVQEALVAAGQAPDVLTQREVLARVYVHLAEQAIARGRKPAPKTQEGSAGRRD